MPIDRAPFRRDQRDDGGGRGARSAPGLRGRRPAPRPQAVRGAGVPAFRV